MSRAHVHNCSTCGGLFACQGTEERNHDGHPEVICRSFHEGGYTLCPECDEAADEARQKETETR